MTKLDWMDEHKLKGMSEDELKHAKGRSYQERIRCECGISLTNLCECSTIRTTEIRPSQIICGECSRLYTIALESSACVRGETISEDVLVVFNGNVTRHAFIWEL